MTWNGRYIQDKAKTVRARILAGRHRCRTHVRQDTRRDRRPVRRKADIPLFGLSPDDSAKISQNIEDMTKNSKSLLDMIERYAGIVEQIEKIESDLSKIPRDDELGPKISEINSLHQEVGMLKAEIAHIEQQVSSKRSYKKILQNRLKKMIEAIHRNENASAGVLLASKMQNVLDTYYANLKERKIADAGIEPA